MHVTQAAGRREPAARWSKLEEHAARISVIRSRT
jgi:hypothetical protein